MKIAVINSPERTEKDDLENLRMAISKYTPIDSVITVRGYDGLITQITPYNMGPILRDGTNFARTLTTILSPANYKIINELLGEADVLVILPALDRTGLCENIINRWFRLHGYDSLEIL